MKTQRRIKAIEIQQTDNEETVNVTLTSHTATSYIMVIVNYQKQEFILIVTVTASFFTRLIKMYVCILCMFCFDVYVFSSVKSIFVDNVCMT